MMLIKAVLWCHGHPYGAFLMSKRYKDQNSLANAAQERTIKTLVDTRKYLSLMPPAPADPQMSGSY